MSFQKRIDAPTLDLPRALHVEAFADLVKKHLDGATDLPADRTAEKLLFRLNDAGLVQVTPMGGSNCIRLTIYNISAIAGPDPSSADLLRQWHANATKRLAAQQV